VRQRTWWYCHRDFTDGDFEFVLHKHRDLGGTTLEGLSHPMLETENAWSVYGFTYPNYLGELGAEKN
jgi:hypothetical protein